MMIDLSMWTAFQNRCIYLYEMCTYVRIVFPAPTIWQVSKVRVLGIDEWSLTIPRTPQNLWLPVAPVLECPTVEQPLTSPLFSSRISKTSPWVALKLRGDSHSAMTRRSWSEEYKSDKQIQDRQVVPARISFGGNVDVLVPTNCIKEAVVCIDMTCIVKERRTCRRRYVPLIDDGRIRGHRLWSFKFVKFCQGWVWEVQVQRHEQRTNKVKIVDTGKWYYFKPQR